MTNKKAQLMSQPFTIPLYESEAKCANTGACATSLLSSKNKKDKKAQLMSQPFTIILALVVIALIIGVGGYLVFKTMQFGEKIDTAKIQNDFKNSVAEVALLGTGSGDNIEFVLPSGIKGICFVDLKDSGLDLGKIEYDDVFEIVSLYRDTQDLDYNVFFAKKQVNDNDIDSIKIGKLKPARNPLCVESFAGKIKVGLENKGKYVEVSEI